MFAAAREGRGEEVRKGVWEEGVDVCGGEGDEFAEVRDGEERGGKDSKETLLHIAVRSGDGKLVRWLDAHSEFSFFFFSLSLHFILFCFYREVNLTDQFSFFPFCLL